MAGGLSGIPSTAHALLTGGDALAAARAAGTLLGRPGLARGAVVHVALSLGWAFVLTRLLPPRHQAWWGMAAGLGVAALDLTVADVRYPAIAALPRGAQIADHVAFGGLVGVVLARRG